MNVIYFTIQAVDGKDVLIAYLKGTWVRGREIERMDWGILERVKCSPHLCMAFKFKNCNVLVRLIARVCSGSNYQSFLATAKVLGKT
jgi:hypothetical protein